RGATPGSGGASVDQRVRHRRASRSAGDVVARQRVGDARLHGGSGSDRAGRPTGHCPEAAGARRQRYRDHYRCRLDHQRATTTGRRLPVSYLPYATPINVLSSDNAASTAWARSAPSFTAAHASPATLMPCGGLPERIITASSTSERAVPTGASHNGLAPRPFGGWRSRRLARAARATSALLRSTIGGSAERWAASSTCCHAESTGGKK